MNIVWQRMFWHDDHNQSLPTGGQEAHAADSRKTVVEAIMSGRHCSKPRYRVLHPGRSWIAVGDLATWLIWRDDG